MYRLNCIYRAFPSVSIICHSSTNEFMQYSADKGMRRFGTISSARGRPLGEIDVDYSPLQLEDTFAAEDREALAATA